MVHICVQALLVPVHPTFTFDHTLLVTCVTCVTRLTCLTVSAGQNGVGSAPVAQGNGVQDEEEQAEPEEAVRLALLICLAITCLAMQV